jgi:hypothetical protein
LFEILEFAALRRMSVAVNKLIVLTRTEGNTLGVIWTLISYLTNQGFETTHSTCFSIAWEYGTTDKLLELPLL